MSPNIKPRVTDYINQIITYIENLVNTGAAYAINGDVYFRVNKIKDYGALSGINIDDLLVGARIEENTLKESPLDSHYGKKLMMESNGLPLGEGIPGWAYRMLRNG